jgi:hypothetical protein
MRQQRTLRVLAREGLRVDVFDRAGWLIKHRKITSEGLQHTDSPNAPLVAGPVEVPDTGYYRQQIRDGALVVVAGE